MKKIIVNADDYGFDRNRSEAIRECFKNGLLTQTTAMVNMPYCETAIEQARSEGFFDRIGLHLNLTYGMPLTDGIKESRLFCDDNGRFSGMFHRSKIWRLWLPKFERDVVRAEIRAQMACYRDHGLPLMHIDSHHHSHADPSIIGIVLSLAREMGFRSIRISRNVSRSKSGLMKIIIKSIVNRQIDSADLKHADYFGNVLDVVNYIKELPNDAVAETMVHPLYSTGRDMNLNREYCETNGVLCDTIEPIKEICEKIHDVRHHVQCVSYGELS